MTSSRKMSHSGARPIEVRSPLEGERLPGAPAAGADDQRRALDPQLREREAVVLGLFVGREGHRRVGAALLLVDQQRAALRAVVGGLGVLEAALRAVDVGHCSAASSSSSGRAAAPSRRGSPPACRRRSRAGALLLPNLLLEARDWSSARRMSILPCRRRRSVGHLVLLDHELADQVAKLLVGQRLQDQEVLPRGNSRVGDGGRPHSKPATRPSINLDLRV